MLNGFSSDFSSKLLLVAGGGAGGGSGNSYYYYGGDGGGYIGKSGLSTCDGRSSDGGSQTSTGTIHHSGGSARRLRIWWSTETKIVVLVQEVAQAFSEAQEEVIQDKEVVALDI